MEICWLVINSWEQTTFWFRISDAFWWLYSQNGSKPVTVHHQQTLSLWLTTKHFVLELLSTFNVWLVIYQTLMNVIKKNWAHVFDSFSPINVWKKCIFVCNFYLIKIPLLPSYTHVYVHDVMATITNKHNWSKKGHVFFSQDNDKSCKSFFFEAIQLKKDIFIPGNRICTQLRILPLSQSKSAPRNQFSG